VEFEKSPELESQHIWAVDMQTQKCYKSIPGFYFHEHENPGELTRNLVLSKDRTLMQENIYCLVDYLDQVEFNINQQAAAKIKIFMNFILCMDSIQGLVSINLGNLSKTRKFICILRDIIVSKSIRINGHREKKEKIQEALNKIMLFKKFKQIENKLLTQISLGRMISNDPKSRLGTLLAEYCEIHNNELLKMCCKTGKNLCKYWDINYFIEKGFQDNFMRMVRSYLFEVINCQEEISKFKKIFIINKKTFMTAPSHLGQGLVLNGLDESYDVDAYDHVELVTKIHIEKEIIALFEQGMYKYTFSTAQLEGELKEFLFGYVSRFVKEAMVVNEAEPKLALSELNEVREGQFLEEERFRDKVLKLSWVQFDKMVEMVSLRLEYLDVRLLSLLEKIFGTAE
jgi:hypothetical protein